MNSLRFWLISGLILLCIGCGANSERKQLVVQNTGQPQSQTPQNIRIKEIREEAERWKREEFEKRISRIKLEITALEAEKKFTGEQVEYVKPGAQRGDFDLLNKKKGGVWAGKSGYFTPRTDKEIAEEMQKEPADKHVFTSDYPERSPAARAWKNRYEQWKWFEAHLVSLTDEIANLKADLFKNQLELRGLKYSVIETPTGIYVAPIEERGGNGGSGGD